MKLAVAQTRPVKGNIEANIAGHRRLIDRAVSRGASLLVFPELSITGYEPELAEALATTPDDPRFDDFQRVADANGITVGVGVPLRGEGGISISMVIFRPYEARLVYSKTYIHADEEPFFISGEGIRGLVHGDATIALAICYEVSVDEHAERVTEIAADYYVACAVKAVSHMPRTDARLAEIAKMYAVPVLFSNCVGLSGGYDCAGNSAVWGRDGQVIGRLNGTDEGILVYDTETQGVVAQTV